MPVTLGAFWHMKSVAERDLRRHKLGGTTPAINPHLGSSCWELVCEVSSTSIWPGEMLFEGHRAHSGSKHHVRNGN